MSIDEIYAQLDLNLSKVIAAFKKELSKQRTGRAQPSLIASLLVESYGQKMPLEQVASITTEGSMTLAIKPWDKSAVPAIERAIMTSDLGLNPSTSGDITRVTLPPLTEERRKEMVKSVKTYQENTKISVRNHRRDAIAELKALEKESLISEDDLKRSQDKVQQIIDKAITSVDLITSEKESDIMKV